MMYKLLLAPALLVSGFLSGCGFSPLHNATGTSSPLGNINIQMNKGSDVVDNQAGFFVTQRLRDRISTHSTSAPYTLEFTPRYGRSLLGLTDGDVASRYDISVTTNWQLLDSKTRETLKSGQAKSIVTFGAPSGPYGVITADNVGVEQSAKETADKMIVQLASYFAVENKKAVK